MDVPGRAGGSVARGRGHTRAAGGHGRRLGRPGTGAFDRTSLAGKASGEVVRRAQAAKKRVAVVAGKVVGLIGIHALDGEGRMLDAAGIAELAERAARQAFGLPLP